MSKSGLFTEPRSNELIVKKIIDKSSAHGYNFYKSKKPVMKASTSGFFLNREPRDGGTVAGQAGWNGLRRAARTDNQVAADGNPTVIGSAHVGVRQSGLE